MYFTFYLFGIFILQCEPQFVAVLVLLLARLLNLELCRAWKVVTESESNMIFIKIDLVM